jgi:hypothetical protein
MDAEVMPSYIKVGTRLVEKQTKVYPYSRYDRLTTAQRERNALARSLREAGYSHSEFCGLEYWRE